jgi:hypothetical protein
MVLATCDSLGPPTAGQKPFQRFLSRYWGSAYDWSAWVDSGAERAPAEKAEVTMTAGTSKSAVSVWIRARRPTLMVIGGGTVSWAIAFGLAWLLWPTSPPVPPSDRVSYALQLGAAPAILMLLMIGSCFRLFDTVRAENPFEGAESQRFKINQRVLTNTVEQTWVFVPLLLALAPRLPSEQIKLLPIAVSIWCLGRVMFWRGYHVAPHWRGPGFDWTICTSGLLAGWFVYTLV